MKSEKTRKSWLAAVDLDGTLLGPTSEISAENLDALKRLDAAGFHVAIATGRHHLNVLPIVSPLPAVRWIVSAQGAEVSDLLRRRTLLEVYLDPAVAEQLARRGRDLGYTTIIYAREAVYTLATTRWSTMYAELSGLWPKPLQVEQVAERRVFKVLWLADGARIAAVPELPGIGEFGVYRVQTHEHIVEFLSPHASKGVGVAALAGHLRTRARRVVCFGDGENDIPMFQWSGISIAMPHGWPGALKSASHVAADGPADSAFCRAVDLALQLIRGRDVAA